MAKRTRRVLQAGSVRLSMSGRVVTVTTDGGAIGVSRLASSAALVSRAGLASGVTEVTLVES